MAAAARRGDRSAAARLAHRIKGSSLSVGAAAMTRGCLEMEQLCGAASFPPEEAEALAVRLRGVFDETTAALARIARERKAPEAPATLQ